MMQNYSYAGQGQGSVARETKRVVRGRPGEATGADAKRCCTCLMLTLVLVVLGYSAATSSQAQAALRSELGRQDARLPDAKAGHNMSHLTLRKPEFIAVPHTTSASPQSVLDTASSPSPSAPSSSPKEYGLAGGRLPANGGIGHATTEAAVPVAPPAASLSVASPVAVATVAPVVAPPVAVATVAPVAAPATGASGALPVTAAVRPSAAGTGSGDGSYDCDVQPPSPEALFAKLDQDGSGTASRQELLDHRASFSPTGLSTVLDADVDGDGSLTRQEFGSALTRSSGTALAPVDVNSWPEAQRTWCCKNAQVGCQDRRRK